MKKRTIRKIVVVVALIAVGVPYYQYWSGQKEFDGTKQFFRDLSEVIDIAAEENSTARDADYGAEIGKWNDMFASRLKRIFANYRGLGKSHIDTSADIAEKLFDALFELRNETIPLYTPLFKERMLDKSTLNNEAELQWRLSILDEVDQYNLRYPARILEITESFRDTVVSSGLPEKYRVYIWDNWGHSIPKYINKLGPPVTAIDGLTSSYRRLFNFMYEHRNAFYINQEGKLVFTDARNSATFQSLKYAAGMLDW
jgi:hypothetical protein